MSRKAKLNTRLYFPDWEGVLSRSSLPPDRQESMAITIRWYLDSIVRGERPLRVRCSMNR